jgi:hypothetical protein
MNCASSIHNKLDTLWLIFLYSQALLISTSASKFSKAANLFEILTGCSSLRSTSFLFLEIEPVHMNTMCCSFTHCQSLTNFYHHQIVVSITICFPERTDIMYTWMLSPIYQNKVNLIVSLAILQCPGKFMNVTIWKHCTLTFVFLDVAKFTTLTPLSLITLCKLWFPVVGLKMFSLPT